MNHIKIKKLELNDHFKNYILENSDELNFNQLNIFVGANNSGKSRFIRKLLDKQNCLFILYNIEYKKKCNEIYNKMNFIMKNKISKRIHLYKSQKDTIDTLLENFNYKYVTSKTVFNDLNNVVSHIGQLYTNNAFINTYVHNQKELVDLANEIQKLHKLILDDFNKRKLVYIPTLRGLRNLGYICQAKSKINECFKDAKLERDVRFSDDFYTGRTLKDYWPEHAGNFVIPQNNIYDYSACEKKLQINILTGLNLFEDLTDMLLGTPSEREKIKEWQKFLSTHFFNEEITITPNRQDGIVNVQIGNDKEFGIHNLGDGLQTIIILTFSLFKYMDNLTILVIEEPELFLHPGYQRMLIEVMLMEKFKNIQYFITTHSNHFLDLIIDYPSHISVYNMRKSGEDFLIGKRSDESSLDLLINLGVRPSSLFLSNAVIMVEGISDIIYLQKYLDLYMQEMKITKFQLDKHYTFLESSGSNIIHWDFLDGPIKTNKILYNVFIVVDDDNELASSDSIEEVDTELSEKQKRLIKIKERDNSYVLNVREMENLISPLVLKKAIIQNESNYRNKKREIDENLIPDFDYSEYKNEYLGKFIDKKLRRLRNKVINTYKYGNQTEKGGTGTINNKVRFSKLVVNNIKSYNELTYEAKDLVEKIFGFIEEKNK